MNRVRWRILWAVLASGLGLATPALAQLEDQQPSRTTLPNFVAAPTQGAVEKKSSVLPPADETPSVPVVPGTPSFVDNTPEKGQGESKSGVWILDGEYLLMAARLPNQQFAVAGNNPVLGPIGEIKSVDGGYHSGFRLGAAYRIPGEDVEVAVRYMYLNTDDSKSANQPANGVLFATQTQPGLVSQVQSAFAFSTVNLNVVDLELARRFEVSPTILGRVFVGPRFASIAQNSNVTYTGGDVSRDDIRSRLTFQGGGIRAGGEVQWKFWNHLGTYARASGALMTGSFHNQYSETANGLAVDSVTQKYTRIIPNMEMGLGLQYQTGGLRFSVGYEFITYFDMVDNVNFVDDANPAKMSYKTGNLGFDGIVFRGQYVF